MKSKFNITKEKLKELYIDKNMRRSDVAKYFGCSDAYIKVKIRKYGLQKPHGLECKNKERWVDAECLYCNKTFKMKPFRITNDNWPALKYCSHKCSSDARYLGENHKRAVRNSVAATRRARLRESLDPNRDCDKIREMYLEAKRLSEETGIPHEVDHIIPIAKGGKHHEDNLRVITQHENRTKGSKRTT